MNPEEKAQLKEVLGLSEENNKILRKMRNSMRWSQFFRFIYWIIIIGTAIGAFYYLQPYLDKIVKAYNVLQSTTSVLPAIPSLPHL